MPSRSQLQLALDMTSAADAIKMVQMVYPHFDIAEIGTPLLIEEGLDALEALQSLHPDKHYLADTKIVDAGYLEASSAFKRGADIVTVLGVADDRTIQDTLKAAREYGGRIMVDLLHCDDPLGRAVELDEMGVGIICLHTAVDCQAPGVDPLAELFAVRGAVGCLIAVAGGLKLENVGKAAGSGADIVVVGSGITGAGDPSEVARQIVQKLGGAQ